MQNIVKKGMKTRFLSPVARHAAGCVRVFCKPNFNLSLARRIKLPIHEGVQFGVGNTFFVHFTLRMVRACAPSSMRLRNSSRARDRRDITVPTGTSIIPAASA